MCTEYYIPVLRCDWLGNIIRRALIVVLNMVIILDAYNRQTFTVTKV